MIEAARRTRKTLYIVAGLYVGIGFLVAAGAAMAGDRLSAFLGFLIISGALAVGVVVSAVLRIGVRLDETAETIKEVRARLGRLEKNGVLLETRAAASSAGDTIRTIDLGAVTGPDPTLITAGILDGGGFPRLAEAGTRPERASTPAGISAAWGACAPQAPGARFSASESSDELHEGTGGPGENPDATETTPEDPWQAWEVARDNGDLAACRSILSALVDTESPDAVAQLTAELAELTSRTEAALRSSFSACIREGDYAGAVAVGRRMCALLPGRPVIAEFERVRPLLERRLAGDSDDAAECATLSVAGTR
jgi:hypothetical protein